MSFELLSEPIRRYIREKRWESLRPIQNAAISKILETENNYVLSARTASGKTEAAFLPILSKVDFELPGVRVLYISPLKALINDQFYRVEDLCKHLYVTVTKWHGDANRSQKQKLLKRPSGIVLITPESIEAMFVNRPYDVKSLFSNLDFVVIDEIHSFVGTERGTQLKSLLSRVSEVCTNKFRVIGLSATVGDVVETKRFIGSEEFTKILVDNEKKEIDASFRYFESETPALPLDLLKDLYSETLEYKSLVFPNSRGKVEEVSVGLKKLARHFGSRPNYFSHHSSVDKDVREYVEFFAKKSEREKFCIACTSTLELGIDIGTLDKVVQIDSTHSVSSLVQRVGRSGRSDSKRSNLLLYATTPWNLLQSLACYELYAEGWVEPPRVNEKPFDILLHQALSIVKSRSGLNKSELVRLLNANSAFGGIAVTEIEEIIEHLIKIDFFQKLGREVIIGIEGEYVVNSRDFYTVFSSDPEYKVIHGGNRIGSMVYSAQLDENENVFLAARIWKITNVDHDSMEIQVIAANDGRPPIYSGGSGEIHPGIGEKMFEIVMSDDKYDYLDESGCKALFELKKFFSNFEIKDLNTERPLHFGEKELTLYTFTGSRINNTIRFLLKIAEIENRAGEGYSSFAISISLKEFGSKWKSLSKPLSDIDSHIKTMSETNPAVLITSKWSRYLPEDHQIHLQKQSQYDLPGTKAFISNIRLVRNRRI